MSETNLFVQVEGQQEIRELAIPENATIDDLRDAVTASGITIDPEALLFIDEDKEPLTSETTLAGPLLKRGSRLYVTRCTRIKVTAHFADKIADEVFPPGTRVRKVKEWAVHTFKMSPKDAAEHILQLCKSTKCPPSDTPLAQLVDGKNCSVCFDLVPDKRVEG